MVASYLGSGLVHTDRCRSSIQIVVFALRINPPTEENNDLFLSLLTSRNADSTRVTAGYISNAWTDIDLSVFGYVKKLSFAFDSNIKNDSGILIPTYLCIDNIKGELENLD